MQISGQSKIKFPIQVRKAIQLSLPTQSLHYKNLCEKYTHIRVLPIAVFKDDVPKFLLVVNLKLCLPTRIKQGNKHNKL